MLTRRSMVMVLSLASFFFGASVRAEKPMGKLIEMGWDCPDVPFVVKNIKAMEKMPFDGVVIDLGRRNGKTPGERISGFGWFFWQREPISEDLAKRMQEDVALLAKTKFENMDHNFIRINTHPGGIDWFDNAGYENVMTNWRLLAKAVKQTGLRGIFFDNEWYAKQKGPHWQPCTWQYDVQPQHDKHNFDAYQKRAYRRGRDIMRIVRQESPGITILVPFADSYLAKAGGTQVLSTHRYGLFPAFLDGMLAEAGNNVKIVDGYENAYGFREESQFVEARNNIVVNGSKISWNPERYRSRIRPGYGLFIDRVNNKEWHANPADFDKNAYTPQELAHVVHSGLKHGDYVWIYSHMINWWTGENCPEAYVQALAKARLPQEPDKPLDRQVRPQAENPLD